MVRCLVLLFTFIIYGFFYLLFRFFPQWQVVVNSSIWILPVTFEFYFCNRNLSTVLWHYCTDYAHLALSIYWAISWENMQLHALIVKSKGINYKLHTHRWSYAHISYSEVVSPNLLFLLMNLIKTFFVSKILCLLCVVFSTGTIISGLRWGKRNFVKGG